jgi:hypothetical protein
MTASSIEAMPRPIVGSLAGSADEAGIARTRGREEERGAERPQFLAGRHPRRQGLAGTIEPATATLRKFYLDLPDRYGIFLT